MARHGLTPRVGGAPAPASLCYEPEIAPPRAARSVRPPMSVQIRRAIPPRPRRNALDACANLSALRGGQLTQNVAPAARRLSWIKLRGHSAKGTDRAAAQFGAMVQHLPVDVQDEFRHRRLRPRALGRPAGPGRVRAQAAHAGHPGGGHFGLLAGRAGAEAAAAAGIFGEEISGLRAVQLGLAWEALPSEQVEERAAELARRPPATRSWPGRPRRACAPSSGRPGCRRRPRSRSSAALSSGRCAAGSPNSQSRPYPGPRVRHYPCLIKRANSIKSRPHFRGYAAGREPGAYTPSSQR